MNIWSTVRKILGLKKKRIDPQGGSDVLKKRKKEVGIPKEVLDKLPPGVKVQRVEIGPRQIIRLVIYGVLVWWLVTTMQGALSSESVMSVPLSTAIEAIRKDNSAKITVMDNQILVEVPSESKILVSSKEGNSSMAEILQREGISLENIEFEVQNRQGWKLLGEIFTLVLTLGLPLFVIYMVFMRQGKGGGMGGGIFGFGKSTAKLFVKGKQKVRFGDVAGVKEAKDDLMEVVDFLKNPTKYSKMGARVPKGVLLIGPSGVGKTLLARAVAGEANVPFYSMAGSEFMEMLVGVGASVVGDTPVLVKEGEEIRLKPMAEVVDKYYGKEEAGGVKKVKGLETLGFEKAENKFWGTSSKKTEKFVFSHSAWKKVEGVLRHKVNEIYEIEFLDGKLRTTGDHSVFVRKQGWIEAKRVDELEPGDILVNLPMKTRKWDYDLKKTIHKVKAHVFGRDENKWLDVWQDNQEEWVKYEKAIENPANLYQKELAAEVGVCQMTVSNWQRGIHVPRAVSKRLMKLKVPERVRVSEDLMWLLGIYTAEGRGTNNLELTFGVREDELISKTAWLMKKVFGLGKPVLKATETNSMKVIYYSAHLGRFFAKWCGNGSHNKHIPELLWRLPKGYFLAYLKGWMEGDGYEYKSGKLTGVSVSRRLVRELAWLASMHGIKVGIREELVKGGRVIRSKALPDSRVWKLIIGKTSNPDMISKYPNQFKKCYVRKVTKRKFEGYVYDLCGVENEGFFGGEKPMLLHNSRVRDLFTTAKKAGKAIIFIDEIDAIGRMRGGMDGGHGEREQTLNQILVEMDGFEPNQTIIVLAATNRGDLLDPALMRPGRFDRRVMLEMPDIDDRIAILKIHAKGKPFSRVKWEDVAKATVGFSGADLENMLNEAAIGAARVGKKTISMRDINEASLKVKLGAEKRRRLTEKDKKMTAYHEAGHAVVNYALKLDPVERISVVSRGMALGFTLTPPKRDRVHETKTRLVKQMAMAMGGRAAEELEFGDMTTGAAADIAQSTRIARRMVTEWGMSDLGPVNLGPEFDTENMSMGYLRTDETSETMRAKVDEEIGKLVDEAIGKARRVLKEHKKELDEVAELLVKKESLERKDFENVMSR